MGMRVHTMGIIDNSAYSFVFDSVNWVRFVGESTRGREEGENSGERRGKDWIYTYVPRDDSRVESQQGCPITFPFDEGNPFKLR